MSVKIRISYQTQEELERVLKMLLPLDLSFKIAKKQQGIYKNAYLQEKRHIE